MKILAQYNRSLEESEEELVLVEMLGRELIIRLESDLVDKSIYDADIFSPDDIHLYPKILKKLREIQENN